MEDKQSRQDDENDISGRFPQVPSVPGVPEPPKLAPTLPPHPEKPRPGTPEPGNSNQIALAATAASSFIMPVIVLSLGGWWLDKTLHHTTFWMAFIGVLLGLVVGITALLRIMNRLSG